MRYFFDTEFNQNVDPVQLISIGIISEDGRELYAVSSEFDESACDDWLRKHVLPKDLLYRTYYTSEWGPRETIDNSLANIRRDIQKFTEDDRCEFWGYYADYDWYLMTRLMGGWFNMPKNFPMLCMDVKQYAIHAGVKRLPMVYKPEHHALVDARWTKSAFEFIRDGYDASGR